MKRIICSRWHFLRLYVCACVCVCDRLTFKTLRHLILKERPVLLPLPLCVARQFVRLSSSGKKSCGERLILGNCATPTQSEYYPRCTLHINCALLIGDCCHRTRKTIWLIAQLLLALQLTLTFLKPFRFFATAYLHFFCYFFFF